MNETTELKLKRCPFCGGHASIYSVYNGRKQVRCTKCRCRTPRFGNHEYFGQKEKGEEIAVKYWNRRAEE